MTGSSLIVLSASVCASFTHPSYAALSFSKHPELCQERCAPSAGRQNREKHSTIGFGRLRAVALVPLAAILFGTGMATASYAASLTYVPLLANRDVFPTAGEAKAEVLTTPAIKMQPGEIRRVIGQLDVSMPSGHDNPEVGNSVVCYDQGGKPVPNGSAGSGTNYTGNGHAYQWNASVLLVAPASNPAENYFCQIVTYVSASPGFHMTVLAPTPGQTTYGTWLQYSSANEAGGLAWSDNIGGCQTNGSSGCQYVGGPARLHNPASIEVFSGDVFPAGNNATAVDAEATFQITTCTHGTSSCPANERGDSGVYDGKGVSWLELDQLSPDGSVCQAHRAYSEVPGRQVVLSESYDISDAQHHRPLYYDVSAPVSQLCGGSRQFAVDLHIQWTADNGVKIDGGWVNVINSAVATAVTVVPPVVGHDQAQAKEIIIASGLSVAAPNNVASPAIPGLVTDQNAPAGTFEPIGSPVLITVSLGQATVPNVLGDNAVAAEQAIRSAGLVYGLGPPKNTCADPKQTGLVQSQGPPGSAHVAPGSQVIIQIGACAR